jgi:hypothetical protein
VVNGRRRWRPLARGAAPPGHERAENLAACRNGRPQPADGRLPRHAVAKVDDARAEGLVAIFIIKPILEIRILFLLVVAIVFIDLFVAGMIPARRDPARDRIPSLAYRPERCRDADDLDSARP